MMTSLPDHTAVLPFLPLGHPEPVEVKAHESVAGSYRPPEFKYVAVGELYPPHTMSSDPVQMGVPEI
jgi:hypothetical protein